MKQWNGKVALVTGASSGIGEAVAQRLAKEGLKVVVCARRKERIDALVARIGAAGGDASGFEVDLRDESQILGMFDEIRERWGGLDVLVNNAGLGKKMSLCGGAGGRGGSPEGEASSAAWRQMLEVNVLALAICTREAVRDMRARGDEGHVIHVSSMSAHRVPEGSGMYSATKHAVKALTEALRRELRELGSKIRVTAISPGFVQTEFAEVFHGDPEAVAQTYAQFEVLQPDDIADWLVHILSAPQHVQVHDILLRPTAQPS